MNCPDCQAEDIQKIEVIYLKGAGTFNSLGASISQGNGIGLNMTQGGMSSLLAKKLEPPKPKIENKDYRNFLDLSNTFIVIAILIFIGIISERIWNYAFVLLFIPCALAFIFRELYKTRKNLFEESRNYNKTIFPKLYKEWKNSWYCNKCGNIFHTEELSKSKETLINKCSNAIADFQNKI